MQIILIPGLMNDGWVWRHQIGPLSRIAPVTIAWNDGCGSLGAMAERLLSATTGPLFIIGHSMGGRVALEACARAPQRIERLVLLDSGCAGPSDDEADGRLKLVELALRDGMRAVAETWLPPMLSAAARKNKTLIADIGAMLERCRPEDFAGQQSALINRPDRQALLGEIPCPSLFITGSEDALSPPGDNAAMARLAADGRFTEISGAGHFVPVEAPEKLNEALIGFLAG